MFNWKPIAPENIPRNSARNSPYSAMVREFLDSGEKAIAIAGASKKMRSMFAATAKRAGVILLLRGDTLYLVKKQP